MDLFRELEKALRTYPKRLLIDDLLPEPEQIPSSLPEESSPHLPLEASGATADPNDEAGFIRGNLRETLEKMNLSEDTGPDDTAGGDNLQDEVQEFLAHQKNRGVHGDPGPVEETDSPPTAPPPQQKNKPPNDSNP